MDTSNLLIKNVINNDVNKVSDLFTNFNHLAIPVDFSITQTNK